MTQQVALVRAEWEAWGEAVELDDRDHTRHHEAGPVK